VQVDVFHCLEEGDWNSIGGLGGQLCCRRYQGRRGECRDRLLQCCFLGE
jgi:hypothetical protein